MTVAELIEKLKEMPQESNVLAGSRAYFPITSVFAYTNDKAVTIIQMVKI